MRSEATFSISSASFTTPLEMRHAGRYFSIDSATCSKRSLSASMLIQGNDLKEVSGELGEPRDGGSFEATLRQDWDASAGRTHPPFAARPGAIVIITQTGEDRELESEHNGANAK